LDKNRLGAGLGWIDHFEATLKLVAFNVMVLVSARSSVAFTVPIPVVLNLLALLHWIYWPVGQSWASRTVV